MGGEGESQGSVDMIVSSSFLLSVLLVIVMCVQVIYSVEVLSSVPRIVVVVLGGVGGGIVLEVCEP